MMVWGLKEPMGFGDYRPEDDHNFGDEMMLEYYVSLSDIEKKNWVWRIGHYFLN